MGMRENAAEREAADADSDGKLDFGEFCVFVREREEGELTDEQLHARFALLDADGSGKIDMAEYLLWSLKDALSRSSKRAIDLFRAWDEDGNGSVDSAEFHRAVRALGFDVQPDDSHALFELLDTNQSGTLLYDELSESLLKGIGSELEKAELKRVASKRGKALKKAYVPVKGAPLPAMVSP